MVFEEECAVDLRQIPRVDATPKMIYPERYVCLVQ